MTKADPLRLQAYESFSNTLQAGLLSLKVSPNKITSEIRYMDLPTFSAPVELLEVNAHFPGATCSIDFYESIDGSGVSYCEVKLHREGKETLFLSDYLVFRKDSRVELLQFEREQESLEKGIAHIVVTVVAVLNEELLPVLQGEEWVTAPFDWGGYK